MRQRFLVMAETLTPRWRERLFRVDSTRVGLAAFGDGDGQAGLELRERDERVGSGARRRSDADVGAERVPEDEDGRR